MSTGPQFFGCSTLAAVFLSDQGVSQAPRARLWPGPGKFSPSEHRQLLERSLPGSGRFRTVVARKRDLRATRAAAFELLRFDLSSLARDPKDGHVLHARGLPDARLSLPSRVNFLQRRAFLPVNAMVVSHLPIRMKPEDPQAMHVSSPRDRQRICARGYVFSLSLWRCGLQANLNSLALLTAKGEMRRLKEPSYSMRRKSRFRPARDAATVGSRTQRMREAP